MEPNRQGQGMWITRRFAVLLVVVCLLLAMVAGTAAGLFAGRFQAGKDAETLARANGAALGGKVALLLADEQGFASGGDSGVTAAKNAGKGTGEATTLQAVTGSAQNSVIDHIMDSVVCIETGSVAETWYGPMKTTGAGSGVIISEDGYILTCAHVIDGAKSIRVLDGENNEYKAAIVARSEETDLALLKIDATGLTAATLGDSDSYQTGDAIYVVGNPLGNFVLSVSQGIISGLDRAVNIEGSTMYLTQVDAAVNPGNSGGGLFDSDGKLIGIVNAKNTGIDVEGMGFAIPIDTVRENLQMMWKGSAQ